MKKKILAGDAEVLMSLLTILKHREEVRGFEGIATLFHRICDATNREYPCPNCGAPIRMLPVIQHGHEF